MDEPLVFEGYLCHSRRKEESWGYEHFLCPFPPVEADEDDYYPRGKILVPPGGATWEQLTDAEDIIEKLKPGARYRVTIEEIDQEGK
jgi:hypothetical protein